MSYSSTVAAEVYFRTLVGEMERARDEAERKVEEARERGEREMEGRRRGVRVVGGEGTGEGREGWGARSRAGSAE